MQKNENNQKTANAHRRVQTSTTLNRRYVSRPDYNMNGSGNKIIKTQRIHINDASQTINRSSRIKRFENELSPERIVNVDSANRGIDSKSVFGASSSALHRNPVQINVVSSKDKKAETPQAHPLQVSANEKAKRRSMKSNVASNTVSAKQMKEQAIQKAMMMASRTAEPEQPQSKSIFSRNKREKKSKMQNYGKVKLGFGRVMLALSCTVAAVFAIVYFVNLNMPDLSLKVAAMQTGIQATYPNYVPRDYALSDIVSENSKVTLNFKKSGSNDTFTIVEEGSSWDSNALMTNYVADNYDEDYTVLREQGLTIYIDNSKACWVNGGILYKLTTSAGTLSKKQIKTIATSL